MAIINRGYFETPDYTASYDYDNVLLKLVTIHVTNRMTVNLTIEVRNAADDSLVQTQSYPPGQTDQALHGAAQAAVILTPEGKVSNLYARTV